MERKQHLQNILLGLLSGPLLAALILLVPMGILTGLSVVLDPSLAMYEFVPEEVLLVPFILLAVLISAANVRLAVVMSRDRKAGRIIKVRTDRYVDDPSGVQNIHGHRGRAFADELKHFIARREDKAVSLSKPIGEDYGWGFWLREKAFSPVWVAIAHTDSPKDNESVEEYIVAITLEPPILPWRRLRYKPDFALRDEVEQRVTEFLAEKNIPFAVEWEEWVDPEPHPQPPPRF
ncbi:hypothetical protein [Methylocystis sp.]|uniref:hypothetical protein n=1 Tax=Methylocystis sp. TaxID=1911079 RepID=UPI002734DD0A|nr:hypothetical protein [Methylocystis sp.]MDP3555209.1 hypothetical protein [Methylocystis sp.]